MSITTVQQQQQPQPVDKGSQGGQGMDSIFHTRIDTNTPAARQALRAGLLEAKEEAHKEARALARWGRPLLLAVIAVSFLHIFDTVSTYKPADVSPLAVPPALHHITEAALVLSIDAVLAFFIAASNVARLAGARPRQWAMWGFILLTFALNMAYMARYAPHIDVGFRDGLLQVLDTFFVFALSAFVPGAIVSVEYASHLIKAARLALRVEVRALQELNGIGGQKPNNAPASDNGRVHAGQVVDQGQGASGPVRAVGGRKQAYQLTDVQAAITGREHITRAELMEDLGCSATTADKLLSEAIDAGKLEKVGKGAYRVIA